LPALRKRLIASLIIGILCFAAGYLTIRSSPSWCSYLQVAASDAVLVKAGGPRLGQRPVSDKIALVLFDFATASELGYVHSYEDDVQVYRRLLDAGASVIFDTRMVAAAEPDAFEGIQPMLEQMLRLDSTGRLMRDVWLSASLTEQHGAKYDPVLAQNPVNAHPHAIPSARSRLYPMVYFTSRGAHESAPLRILRRFERLPSASPPEIGAELLRCGVMSAWHTHSPNLVPKTEVLRSPYQVADRSIVWHEFVSTSSLIPPTGFWVSYDPRAADYTRHSYLNVLRSNEPIDVSGKIVIIGFDSEIDPTSDTYEIPSVAGKACAAEVVASASQTLIDGRMMRDPPRSFMIGVLAVMTMGLAMIGGILRPAQSFAVMIAAFALYYAAAVGGYRAGWYTDFAIAPGFGLMSGLLSGTYSAWQSHQTHQRVVDLFGRYVPRAVVQQLMLKPMLETLAMGGEKREVTVMFADIRGFTTFSEDLPPEEVVKQLNALLRVMVDSTFRYQGTLDKFIGDAILVLFNAPLDQPDHTVLALRTAREIQQQLRGHPSGLGVGIGVHRGEAVVGSIGTPQRMEYTAIGSTVNVASRLCDVARSGEVIVSADVLNALDSEFQFESLPPVTVKGIKHPLTAARLVQER
jgi:adenylate cyclase